MRFTGAWRPRIVDNGDALVRIVKEEGVGGLFTGAGPTVVRAMSLNMGMLASNEQVLSHLSSHLPFTYRFLFSWAVQSSFADKEPKLPSMISYRKVYALAFGIIIILCKELL